MGMTAARLHHGIGLRVPAWAALIACCFFPAEAMAVCSDAFPAVGGSTIVTSIINGIESYVFAIMRLLFESVRTGMLDVIQVTLTLYIAIYGILFTFGMVQMTLYDFSMRMIKFGIIVWLMSPGAWIAFGNTFGVFFHDGTNHLIAQAGQWMLGTVIAIGGGGFGGGSFNSGSPFAILDALVSVLLSPQMFVTWMASNMTGPYGPTFGVLFIIAFGAVVRGMLTAVWVYLMALTVRGLLFGLAPIFLTCLLFDRTRHLFDGWLNQLVNASLQPILLFIFYTFFSIMIYVSLRSFISPGSVPVCWTQTHEALRGTTFSMNYWRFKADMGGSLQPYGGGWSWTGPSDPGASGPLFPIDIIAVLIFLCLAELANRFNHIVLSIANDMASASTNFGMMPGAGMGSMFGGGGGRGGGGGNVGGRAGPPGVGRRPAAARGGVGGMNPDLVGPNQAIARADWRSVGGAAEGAAAGTGFRGGPGNIV